MVLVSGGQGRSGRGRWRPSAALWEVGQLSYNSSSGPADASLSGLSVAGEAGNRARSTVAASRQKTEAVDGALPQGGAEGANTTAWLGAA